MPEDVDIINIWAYVDVVNTDALPCWESMEGGRIMPDSSASDRPVAVGWGFWLWWVLASTMGWAVGARVGVAVGSFGEPPGFEAAQSVPTIIVAGYLGVAVGGILVGVLQSLVLRRKIARAGWWVLAGVGAAAVIGVVVFGVGVVNTDVGWVVGASLFGIVVGVLQWLVLRRQVARAGWWVLASAVGWFVGMPVGGVLDWPALGAAYGAITGIALVWLLRQS
jgi:hypothetical protein